jgi:HK97 family phage major capsid protein
MSEELNSAKTELLEKVKGLVEKAKGDATTDASSKIEVKANELLARIEKSADKAEFDSFKDGIARQVDALELKLKNHAENKTKEVVSVKQAILNAIEEQRESIDKIVKSDGKQTEPLYLKAAVTMGLDNTIEAGSTFQTITQNTGIVSVIRQRQERYLANVSVGPIAGKHALWVEEEDAQGTPIFIGEGDTKTQLSVLYKEKTMPVGKIAVYGKVTTEMLADAGQLASYVQNNLLKRVSVVTENQLLTGDGTGDNLKGLKTYATTFSAGALALAVDNANEFDVLNAMALQVEIANGIPIAVFVHPSTIARMKSLKSSTNEPLYKQYTDFAGDMVIYGMRVIATTAVTAGEFIGGDTSVANVLFREGLSIQIGMDGNDFTQNKKTILVEQRLVQFVSANDTPVIVKGVFSTAKAALETA